MRPRPLSITIIGWYLLVVGFLTLPGAFGPGDDPQVQAMFARQRVPVAVQQAVILAGSVANLVSGYFLLRGQNWARHLYVAWTLVQFGYAWLAIPYRLVIIPGALLFLLIVYLLFRPRANSFFAGGELVDVVAGKISPRRVFGIGAYVMAGSFLVCSSFVGMMGVTWETKWGALATMLLPALLFLWIGRALSGTPRWLRDVGVVLVASAAVSACMALSMSLLSADPEFQKLMPPEPLDAYWTGGVWIVLMGLAGRLGAVVTKRDR